MIVIPTFNEAANIADCLAALRTACDAGTAPDVLVVDDNSPDDTGGVVRRLARGKWRGRLFLMVRDRKRGLGTAYIEGFKWGLEQGYTVLVEMDGDLSHHPRHLAAMMDQLRRYDFVVGSRYVCGGGVRGWGWGRLAISRLGSLYARIVLGLPIRDLTGGFNAWNRAVLEKINLNAVVSEGYAFQIELKYRAAMQGFRWREWPIVFEDRRRGRSKMSRRIVLEAVYRVWQLKWRSGRMKG